MGKLKNQVVAIKASAAFFVCSLVGQPSLADVELLNRSTVRILSATEGSGALIYRNQNIYTVATVWHVIAGANPSEEIWVMTSDHKKHNVNHSSIERFPGIDMAVLKFSSAENYPTLSIGSTDLVDSKSTLFIAGWPLGGNRKSAKISIGKLIASSAVKVENGYSLIYTNKTSPGMMVFMMFFKVSLQIVDVIRQQSHLNLRRASISFFYLKL